MRKRREKPFLILTPVPSTKSTRLLRKVLRCCQLALINLQLIYMAFFKWSSARREDYSNLQDLTEVASQYVLRHSSVRWLTSKFVLVRIIEQWTNLTEYFCKYIPKQKEFKSSIKDIKRYKNIIECLNDDLTLLYLSYVVFLANEYESFLLTFQTENPLNHMLSYGMSGKTK